MQRIQKNISGTQSDRQAIRRGNREKRQAKIRPGRNAAHDFVKQTFYPLSAVPLPNLEEIQHSQKSIGTSINYLCRLYGFSKIPLLPLPYPLDIYFAYDKMAQLIKTRDEEMEIIITGSMARPVMGTVKKMITGCNLYYIPLLPLHQLLSNPSTKEVGELLLAAYSYLHHAGVSLCNASSFIGYEMEMVQDAYRDGSYPIDEPERIEAEEEAELVIQNCDTLCQQIADHKQLSHFTSKLLRIKSKIPKEQAMILAIRLVHQLSIKYPDRNFVDNIHSQDSEQEEQTRMAVEHYLSFYWGGCTPFEDQLMEWIDSYLQEMTGVDEPVSIQVFDRPQRKQTHDFRFEEKFLQAIANLNSALYAY